MNRLFAFLPMLGAAAGLLCLAPACKEQSSPGPQGSHSASAKPLNPDQTVLELRERYSHRQYAKMAPLVRSEALDDLFRLLAGVEQLSAANARVQSIINEKLGSASTDRWDLAALRENLGIFSDGVTLIDTSIEGDRATVVYQVKNLLPLASAMLIRREGAWQYHPELDTELPQQIVELAESLAQLGDVLEARERLSPAQVDSEYRYRIVPRIEQLAARDESRNPGPGSED